jgi:hypothetical protein
LTARSGPAPVGGLPGGTTAIDPEGNGALRLTNNQESQSTFVIYNQPINRASGLSINFDLYSYGGTGADGISFFLIDGSANPTAAGASGGSLGYSSSLNSTGDGLVGGYIGIAFDEFGNFSTPGYGSGGPGFSPDTVAIRGSQATNYKYLTGATVPEGTSIDNTSEGATRSNSKRNVQIDLTPEGLVSVQMDLNNNNVFDENEKLITNFNVTAESANNAPLPQTFKFGFSGGTGASTNIHEINNFRTNTFTGSYIPLVNLANTNVNTVPENGNLTITAQLDRPTSSAVTVPLTLTGTAVSGVDYNIPTSITFAPNQQTASVTLTPVDNTGIAPNKTVAIALGTPTNAQLSPQNNNFTVTILDNEDPSLLQGSFNFENQLRVLVNRGNDLVNLLYDNQYYLNNNLDVAAAVANGQFSSGFQHFQQFGQFEGRDPSVIFSNSLYLSQNSDVAAFVASGRLRSGFEHFVNYGFKSYEHRDLRMLSFDEGYYLSQNQDVFTAVRAGQFDSGFEHYLLFGQKEGRNPSLKFNEAYYLANNPDVSSAVTQGAFQSGFDHYVRFGIFEGRNPISTFDNNQYLLTNTDVGTLITRGSVRSGTEHGVRNGQYEGRAFLPQVFDEQYYLTQYLDVASFVTQDILTGGLDHYTLYGQKEGRSPSTSYNENFYLTRYSDVASAVAQGIFKSGFEHFILYGRAENRLGVG